MAVHTVRALEHEPGPVGHLRGGAAPPRGARRARAAGRALRRGGARAGRATGRRSSRSLRGRRARRRRRPRGSPIPPCTSSRSRSPSAGTRATRPAAWRDDDAPSRADLAGDGRRRAPRIGQLARGLQARMANGEAGGMTVISCDNVPAQRARAGAARQRLLRALAARRARGRWRSGSSAHARFPCTMVDRVVPTPSPHDREAVRRLLGVDDHAAVAGEPFSQWVLEDAFAGPRPAWERGGVQIVADSAPWELLKLRLLNAAHCAPRVPRRPAGRHDGGGGAARRRGRGRGPAPAPRRPRPDRAAAARRGRRRLRRGVPRPLREPAARPPPAADRRRRVGEARRAAVPRGPGAAARGGGAALDRPRRRRLGAPPRRRARPAGARRRTPACARRSRRPARPPERRAAAFLGVREVFGEELGESAVFRALVADGLARLDAGVSPMARVVGGAAVAPSGPRACRAPIALGRRGRTRGRDR